MRTCKKCGVVKSVDEFPVAKNKQPNGSTLLVMRRVCSGCYFAGIGAWKVANRTRVNQWEYAWRRKNRARHLGWRQEWRDNRKALRMLAQAGVGR